MGLLVFALPFAAYAQDYSCHVKANSNRGFSSDFDVEVSPAAVGGQISLIGKSGKKPFGTVAEAVLISRALVTEKQAFDLTLGLIAEQDVSGIAPQDLGQVTSIRIFKAPAAGGDETIVYQFLAGNKQIGGTFMTSGLGTSCLPK
jgi:hypothetical protein